MIETPTNLNYSGQRSHPLSNSSYNNNDTATLHPVIEDICDIKKVICE